MSRRVSIVLFVVVSACGGGTDDPAGSIDAPASVDAAAASVVEVTPCTGESATVTTSNSANSFSPSATTISVNQIVKFTNSSAHDVAPTGASTDTGLRVGFGATKCLRFTKAGTFGFKCTPHGFTGSITVN